MTPPKIPSYIRNKNSVKANGFHSIRLEPNKFYFLFRKDQSNSSKQIKLLKSLYFIIKVFTVNISRWTRKMSSPTILLEE